MAKQGYRENIIAIYCYCYRNTEASMPELLQPILRRSRFGDAIQQPLPVTGETIFLPSPMPRKQSGRNDIPALA